MRKSTTMPIRFVTYLIAALAVVALAPAAAQAKWPERAVTLVVPYPPGGNVDLAARIISEKLHKAYGQPFVVENKSGAGGLIGAEAVARSKPDGYTYFVGANGPILFAPTMAKRDAYQWQRDFIPITMISLTPIVLQVNPKIAAKTLKEFFALARSQPGKLNMASPGPGTTNHLLSELAKQKLGLDWATVHYKGNTPATKDLIAGHVDFNFDQTTVSLPYIKAGKTRALAITGNKRAPWLPDVPTFIELGYKDLNGVTFTGLLAPKGTPPEIIDSISKAMIKILKSPDVVKQFNDIGAASEPMTPAEFTKFLENEDKVWMPFVRSIAATKK